MDRPPWQVEAENMLRYVAISDANEKHMEFLIPMGLAHLVPVRDCGCEPPCGCPPGYQPMLTSLGHTVVIHSGKTH